MELLSEDTKIKLPTSDLKCLKIIYILTIFALLTLFKMFPKMFSRRNTFFCCSFFYVF